MATLLEIPSQRYIFDVSVTYSSTFAYRRLHLLESFGRVCKAHICIWIRWKSVDMHWIDTQLEESNK